MQVLDNNIYDARNLLEKNKSKSVRKVCALTRVSTQHEQQTNALENQNQWIVNEISKHSDWVFYRDSDLYIDEGVSGTSTKNRGDFNRMIEKAKSGKYDLIVTREVCRFMRNAKETLVLVEELKKCGVEVYFINDSIWTFNEDDYFKLTIMATYAEQESRKVSERVFAGQAVARINGIHFGSGNILGYDIVKGEKSCDTTYKINEDQAKTVRKIFQLIGEGMGMSKIKAYLEENGYLTSQGNTRWHTSTIERIARRRTYMGEYEYLQSVTEDPLSHKRVMVNDRSKRVQRKGKFPAIISPEEWFNVQKIIDSRINHNLVSNTGKKLPNPHNKDVYCRKLRCGCGRRFRKDLGRRDGTGTYRCYAVVDDGSQELRQKKSENLKDDCSIKGIIDWKLDLFTLTVFSYLDCHNEFVREKLLAIIEKNYTQSSNRRDSVNDELRLQKEIERLEKKKDRLVDALADGLISKDVYIKKLEDADSEIRKLEMELTEIRNEDYAKDVNEQVLREIRNFVESSLTYPTIDDDCLQVSEELVEVFVNSVKARANNVFEYNIQVNPNAEVDSPLYCPDEEYIPSVHPAVKNIDNSNAVLLTEIEVDYETAKKYANRLKRKVVRVHWEVPARIRIYLNI